MLFVTLDSNVWRPIGDPEKFPRDPLYNVYKKINSAIKNGTIEGRLSESIFTLEGIKKADRKNTLSKYRPKINFDTNLHPSGSIVMNISIGPDVSAHPGNNPHLDKHLSDALSLGFKLMRCPRLAGMVNPDIRSEWYVNSATPSEDWANKFGEVGRRIEGAGAGIAWIKAIGQAFAQASEPWIQGLANAPAVEDMRIATAVAEWADGDMVSAHIAYGNHYLCTRDSSKAAGQNSIFSAANRAWLEADYEVKLVSPEELANLV